MYLYRFKLCYSVCNRNPYHTSRYKNITRRPVWKPLMRGRIHTLPSRGFTELMVSSDVSKQLSSTRLLLALTMMLVFSLLLIQVEKNYIYIYFIFAENFDSIGINTTFIFKQLSKGNCYCIF